MLRLVAGLTVIAILLISMTALAGVKEDYESSLGVTCTEFQNHSGFVPGSYDVAVFIEDGFDDETHLTNGSDLNIPPPSGRSSWDTVLKCHLNPTTTTSTTKTSTSITTTTTLDSTTTTNDTTTTSRGSTSSTDQQSTTTTEGESSTITTISDSTTSSSIVRTTTSTRPATTTTVLTTSTSQPLNTTPTTMTPPTTTLTTPSTSEPPKELPLTGGNLIPPLLLAASLSMYLGVLLVRSRR